MHTQPLPVQERRRQRSGDRIRAIQLLLDRVRTQHDQEILVVADADGLLVAASGSPEAAEALAAYAPLLHRTPHGRARAGLLAHLSTWSPGATADGLHVRRITIEEATFFVAAAGPRNSRTEAGLFRAQTGLVRILR
ncbi:MAG: hypothetical protein EA398_17060 [Deltaproteobacteria bacterium]|nr:MAG: hypothetical protein EA398_17060 [Deltaproteobacteria bacterium]